MLPGFDQAPFAVRYRDVGDRAVRIGATKVIPGTVLHSPGLHCLGYRVEYRGRTLAYSGDSQYCAPLVRLCGDADLAVLDCSFPANRPNPVHLHAGQCGQVAREAGLGRLADPYDVKAQAGEAIDGPITMAKDLLRITL
jgi:ribonuclease BN (tRNA processing enzyme)